LLDENKNQEDSKNDSHVDNQVSLQIENPNLEENQNMVNELNSQDNDIKNLSPTPRKSERDK
jgi:rRNA maturation endonuclease Nob1